MAFVKVREELAVAPSRSFEFEFDAQDAETLFVMWETSDQAVKRFLPPPLQPARRPIALAFITAQPGTGVGPIYREAALALRAKLDSPEEFYYLAMHVTDNVALVYGQDALGYPKKLADIGLYREGQQAIGWVERHGVRFFATHVQLAGRANILNASSEVSEILGTAGGSSTMITCSFKYVRAPTCDGFDFPPRLVRDEVEYRHATVEHGLARVALTPSEFDPWSEVEVVRILGAVYTSGTCSMRSSRLVAEALAFPYALYVPMPIDLR